MDNYSGKIEKLNIWEKVKIKEVCSHIFSGGTPNTNKREYWGGPIPWLSSGETRSRFIKETKNSITELGVQNSSTRLARAGSSVIASAGQGHTRGQVSYLLIDTYINQSVIALFPMEDKLDSKFLFYALAMKYERLRQISDDHSIRGSLTTKILGEEYIQLPSIQEQKAIAKILSDLDSKIELTEKMNKTLEGIAQAIFKHWFIDFEFPNEEGKPYKSSGGEMVDSELGSIPKGWKVKYFKDIVHLNMGVSPKGTSYNTDGIGVPLLNGAADFSSGIIEPKKFTTNPVRMCKKGDLLFCIRATIGNLTYSDKAYCIGRGVAALDPVSEVYKEYSYFTLEYGLNNLILKASGSVIKGLSKDDLLLFKIVTPTDKIISKFHLLVATIFSRIQYLTVENHSLSNIRDSLLPKLMTGKIRVPMEDEHE